MPRAQAIEDENQLNEFDAAEQGTPSAAVVGQLGKLSARERSKIWGADGALKPVKKRRPAPLYKFRVICTRVPSNSRVVEEGDFFDVEAVDESHAIRMFVQKTRIDPAGQGITSTYRFMVSWNDPDNPDPRPKGGDHSEEAIKTLMAYNKLRGMEHRPIMI